MGKISVKDSKGKEGRRRPTLLSYLSLFLLILFFSGASKHLGPYGAWFDYATLVGKFGTIIDATNFLGKGGEGARGALLYATSFIPNIMLAVGVVHIAIAFGALEAAQKLLTPILRPLMGLSGASAVAIVSSLASSDAGAVTTRELTEQGLITEKERTILCAFEFSSGASVIFYFSVASMLFAYLPVSVLAPLGVVLLCKIVGANIMRLYLKKKEGV